LIVGGMKILVINCGSSTAKFQVIETAPGADQDHKLASGLVDRIGTHSVCTFTRPGGEVERKQVSIENHEQAIEQFVDWLDSNRGSGLGARQIEAVGHRVVHGGGAFMSAVRIDDEGVAKIEALNDLAPLHNPPALSGIRAARKLLGSAIPMVAAFDTSFHHTLPAEAATYAIPWELSKKHRIRRYGFHGLAHQYSTWRYGQLTGTPSDKIDLVTLHLGNGCSAAAVRGGKSVDTSMGFTPLEGLVMGTRSGDLDPALISYLARKEEASAEKVEHWLNHRSGLLGVSGRSGDMRDLIGAYDEDPRCRLAVDIFCYRARKYIGAYLAALGGADAVVFSGGIAEKAPSIRESICAGMNWCGIRIDPVKNLALDGRDGTISPADSAIQIYVIHTDEEAIIARETASLLSAAHG
jgi:acetate kinase